ncbi:MAG: hypothetical protein CHACPFDD_01768 [Phycisphaerae bacterium]|nr:hypothetical protein [Phycisphaerae bacterium]
MSWWLKIHRWPAWSRWPLKATLFLAVVALTCFPRVWMLPEWLRRINDMNSVIDANARGLGPFATAARERVAPGADDKAVLAAVQAVVYERIPYAWDWETWGVMDYLPTTAEVLRLGREDCDGRAVLAASVLRHMGYDAWLVNDVLHTWVAARSRATPGSAPLETMSPGLGPKTLEGAEGGTQKRLTWGLVWNLSRGLSYGVAVFPLLRLIIILAALCGLTLHPRSSPARRVFGCLLLVAALCCFRLTDHSEIAWQTSFPTLVWVGGLATLAGWLTLALKARQERPRSATAQLESPATGGAGRD